MRKIRIISILLALSMLASFASTLKAEKYTIPVEYHKLKNGLKVVLSPDPTAPTVVVAVYYNIGFRIEPRNRTGFAHLFEHMMFQGSQNLGKMEFIRLIQNNGGVLNGSTRFDFTNYFEVVPAHKLETVLWAEADRMRGLSITQDNLTNQQGVVTNEVKVNVLNQPYGGFPWLDMPQRANTNWYNAHNFYGELSDLSAATLKDVKDFFHTYYAPNNAALILTGDFDSEEAMRLIERHFADIPAVTQPAKPNLREPRQTKEKKFSKPDPLAKRPGLAFSYHMPERFTPEYFAMGIIYQILAAGDDSLLTEMLVKKKGYAAEVNTAINELGNMYDYNGPMLFTVWLFHDTQVKANEILATTDSAIKELQTKPIDEATMKRAMVKLRSDLYDTVDFMFGFGRADLLACFALFNDDPARINKIEEEFLKVTPELIQKTAKEYLRPSNRTILTIEPKASTKKEE